MKRLKRCVAGLLLLLLLLGWGTFFLLTTASGLCFLLEGAERWVPELTIGSISQEGRELSLHNIHYRTPKVELHIAQLHLDQPIGSLKRGAIRANNVWLQQISIKIGHAQHATTVTLERIDTALLWRINRLILRPTHIEKLVIVSPPSMNSEAEKSDSLPTSLSKLEASLNENGLQFAEAIRLPLAADIQSITGSHWRLLSGDQEHRIDQIRLSAKIRTASLSLDDLSLKIAGTQLNLHGNISLRGDHPLLLNVTGEINEPPLSGERLQAMLTGSLRKRIKLQLTATGPLQLRATAEIGMGQAGVPLTLILRSDHLIWPLTDNPRWQLQALDTRITGHLTAYQLLLKAKLVGNSLPSSEIALESTGDWQQLRVKQLQLSTVTGNALLKGYIAWHKQLHWQGDVRLQSLDIGEYWPAWPHQLTGTLSLKGQSEGNNRWHLAIPAACLQGTLNGHPLTIEGSLQRQSNGTWTTPRLQALSGVNSLEVKGDLTPPWQLTAAVNAPQLTGLLPGLRGAIRGKLALRGTPRNPQLHADVRVNHFHWQQLSIARLILHSRINAGSQLNGQVNLEVERFRQQEIKIDRLQLSATGNEQRHFMHLQFQGEPIAGTFKLQGRFGRQKADWRGELREVSLQTATGNWQPTGPITARYQHLQRHFMCNAHCWQNPSATLCIPKLVSHRGALHSDIEIRRLDLALFKPFLSPSIRLEGEVTGHTLLHWRLGDSWPQLKLSLQGRPFKIAQSFHKQLLPVNGDAFTLEASLDEHRVQLDGSWVLADKGRVQAHLQIEDPRYQRHLHGKLRVEALSLPSFPLRLTPTSKEHSVLRGFLNGQVRLAGTVSQPQLFGDVVVTHSRLSALLPVDNLLDGMLKLKFAGQCSQLRGRFKTTQGALSLQGETQWQSWQQWSSRLRMKGDLLQVNWSPGIQLQAVPDLQVSVIPKQIKLTGQLTIPWARINLSTLPPSAVKVSKNEIVLGDLSALTATKSTAVAIVSEVTLCLRDDVKLEAFGLQSHIDGQMKVVFSGQRSDLYGQLNLREGSFRAYGQNLLIKEGKLLSSGPVGQAMLDVKAIRDPSKTEDNVVVGLEVTGLVDAPNVSVFSEPEMPQQEKLIYLLTGRKQANSNSNAMATQLVLGALQHGKLQGLSSALEPMGISDFSFDTIVIEKQSKVIVSGYVGRNLQLKWGDGLMIARLQLGAGLYLEAHYGADARLGTTLNLIYQFEF